MISNGSRRASDRLPGFTVGRPHDAGAIEPHTSTADRSVPRWSDRNPGWMSAHQTWAGRVSRTGLAAASLLWDAGLNPQPGRGRAASTPPPISGEVAAECNPANPTRFKTGSWQRGPRRDALSGSVAAGVGTLRRAPAAQQSAQW